MDNKIRAQLGMELQAPDKDRTKIREKPLEKIHRLICNKWFGFKHRSIDGMYKNPLGENDDTNE